MNAKSHNPPASGPEVSPLTAGTSPAEAEALRLALAEQKDRNLWLAADFENFKRRTRLESETRATAQKDAFIQELLPAIDNLERALSSSASADAGQFHQGVEMTLQQLRQLLHQHGVKAQECVDQPFDPHQHEAVAIRHDPAQLDHVILAVLQRGYRRGDKVFRPAKVVVNDLTHTNHAHHGR